jgi:hypothetical protein
MLAELTRSRMLSSSAAPEVPVYSPMSALRSIVLVASFFARITSLRRSSYRERI